MKKFFGYLILFTLILVLVGFTAIVRDSLIVLLVIGCGATEILILILWAIYLITCD